MLSIQHPHMHSRKKKKVHVRALVTSALSAVAGPAAVPVVGVEHGDVATLVLQIHMLLQLLQCLVHAHVGVGELCTGGTQHTQWDHVKHQTGQS